MKRKWRLKWRTSAYLRTLTLRDQHLNFFYKAPPDLWLSSLFKKTLTWVKMTKNASGHVATATCYYLWASQVKGRRPMSQLSSVIPAHPWQAGKAVAMAIGNGDGSYKENQRQVGLNAEKPKLDVLWDINGERWELGNGKIIWKVARMDRNRQSSRERKKWEAENK